MHYFIRLLHDKGMLLRCFTQNIDSLEAAAGLPRQKIVAAHGNFDGAHCIDTGEPVPAAQPNPHPDPNPKQLAAHGRGVNKLPGEGLKLGLKTQPFPNPEIIEEQVRGH